MGAFISIGFPRPRSPEHDDAIPHALAALGLSCAEPGIFAEEQLVDDWLWSFDGRPVRLTRRSYPEDGGWGSTVLDLHEEDYLQLVNGLGASHVVDALVGLAERLLLALELPWVGLGHEFEVEDPDEGVGAEVLLVRGGVGGVSRPWGALRLSDVPERLFRG
ncbi:MAG: hypothetical protein H6739_36770 [Alphaproteobacteria bacterium]|nr:hypothetical protein [Alphaproteobacteria bacterium]